MDDDSDSDWNHPVDERDRLQDDRMYDSLTPTGIYDYNETNYDGADEEEEEATLVIEKYQVTRLTGPVSMFPQLIAQGQLFQDNDNHEPENPSHRVTRFSDGLNHITCVYQQFEHPSLDDDLPTGIDPMSRRHEEQVPQSLETEDIEQNRERRCFPTLTENPEEQLDTMGSLGQIHEGTYSEQKYYFKTQSDTDSSFIFARNNFQEVSINHQNPAPASQRSLRDIEIHGGIENENEHSLPSISQTDLNKAEDCNTQDGCETTPWSNETDPTNKAGKVCITPSMGLYECFHELEPHSSACNHSLIDQQTERLCEACPIVKKGTELTSRSRDDELEDIDQNIIEESITNFPEDTIAGRVCITPNMGLYQCLHEIDYNAMSNPPKTDRSSDYAYRPIEEFMEHSNETNRLKTTQMRPALKDGFNAQEDRCIINSETNLVTDTRRALWEKSAFSQHTPEEIGNIYEYDPEDGVCEKEAVTEDDAQLHQSDAFVSDEIGIKDYGHLNEHSGSTTRQGDSDTLMQATYLEEDSRGKMRVDRERTSTSRLIDELIPPYKTPDMTCDRIDREIMLFGIEKSPAPLPGELVSCESERGSHMHKSNELTVDDIKDADGLSPRIRDNASGAHEKSGSRLEEYLKDADGFSPRIPGNASGAHEESGSRLEEDLEDADGFSPRIPGIASGAHEESGSRLEEDLEDVDEATQTISRIKLGDCNPTHPQTNLHHEEYSVYSARPSSLDTDRSLSAWIAHLKKLSSIPPETSGDMEQYNCRWAVDNDCEEYHQRGTSIVKNPDDRINLSLDTLPMQIHIPEDIFNSDKEDLEFRILEHIANQKTPETECPLPFIGKDLENPNIASTCAHPHFQPMSNFDQYQSLACSEIFFDTKDYNSENEFESCSESNSFLDDDQSDNNSFHSDASCTDVNGFSSRNRTEDSEVAAYADDELSGGSKESQYSKLGQAEPKGLQMRECHERSLSYGDISPRNRAVSSSKLENNKNHFLPPINLKVSSKIKSLAKEKPKDHVVLPKIKSAPYPRCHKPDTVTNETKARCVKAPAEAKAKYTKAVKPIQERKSAREHQLQQNQRLGKEVGAKTNEVPQTKNRRKYKWTNKRQKKKPKGQDVMPADRNVLENRAAWPAFATRVQQEGRLRPVHIGTNVRREDYIHRLFT